MKAKIGDFLKIHGTRKRVVSHAPDIGREHLIRIIDVNEFDQIYLLEDGSFVMDALVTADQVVPQQEVIK
jgi:hypothetical protein